MDIAAQQLVYGHAERLSRLPSLSLSLSLSLLCVGVLSPLCGCVRKR